MTTERLTQLITQPEGIKLDFKREYQLSPIPPANTDKQMWSKYITGQWDELIKDVLALTNGNVGTAQEPAYLIIGVADALNSDGARDIHDASGIAISAQQLMARVNSACEPPVSNIKIEDVILDGKCVKVVEMAPSPHVHETTRILSIFKGNFDGSGKLVNVQAGKTYTEYTTFIRNGEDISPASSGIRRALEEDKGYDIAALNDNLKFELLNNLSHLLTKKKSGEIRNPCLFYQNFRENIQLTYTSKEAYRGSIHLEQRYISRMVTALFFASTCDTKIATQILDHAISSGKYLRYSFTQGQYQRPRLLDRLQQLKENIQYFQMIAQRFDYAEFTTKYGEQARRPRDVEIKFTEVLEASGLLARYENVTTLSIALVDYLSGNRNALENIHLNHSTPMIDEQEKISEESLSSWEIAAWIEDQSEK